MLLREKDSKTLAKVEECPSNNLENNYGNQDNFQRTQKCLASWKQSKKTLFKAFEHYCLFVLFSHSSTSKYKGSEAQLEH